MPANRGIGRKHKAGTGGSKSLAAARELSSTKLTGSAPAPLKRSREPTPSQPSGKPSSAVIVGPLRNGCQHDALRAAAAGLDAAVDEFEQAEKEYNHFVKRSTATFERLRKLRAQPGERSAQWTQGWLKQLDQFEAEEERLAIQLERQDAAVSAAQLQLDEAKAMSAPVPCMLPTGTRMPIPMPFESSYECGAWMQNMESMDEQQFAALKQRVCEEEEKAFQWFKTLACAIDTVEQEEAAQDSFAPVC